MPQCCGGRRVSNESRERWTPGPDGVAREKAEGARQRDLLVARTRDIIHDATALALVLDAPTRVIEVAAMAPRARGACVSGCRGAWHLLSRVDGVEGDYEPYSVFREEPHIAGRLT